MTPTGHERYLAIAETARLWLDPDYPLRATTVGARVESALPYTQEALAYMLNQRMDQLSSLHSDQWPALLEETPSTSLGLARVLDESLPLDGLMDAVLLVLRGHRVHLIGSKASSIVVSFFDDVQERLRDYAVPLHLKGDDVEADAWIYPAGHEPQDHPVPIHVHHDRYAVAIVEGSEGDAVWDGLAEDMLLLEGEGSRSVKLVWAPASARPDALLEALAGFRGLVPAHPSTAPRLKMPQAFLKAQDQSHAFADDLSFLLSKGAPEVQAGAHIRWVPYNQSADWKTWCHAHADDVSVLVGTRGVQREAGSIQAAISGASAAMPWAHPGDAHRAPWGADRMLKETYAFVRHLERRSPAG